MYQMMSAPEYTPTMEWAVQFYCAEWSESLELIWGLGTALCPAGRRICSKSIRCLEVCSNGSHYTKNGIYCAIRTTGCTNTISSIILWSLWNAIFPSYFNVQEGMLTSVLSSFCRLLLTCIPLGAWDSCAAQSVSHFKGVKVMLYLQNFDHENSVLSVSGFLMRVRDIALGILVWWSM